MSKMRVTIGGTEVKTSKETKAKIAKVKPELKKKPVPKKEKAVIVNGRLMIVMQRNVESGRNNPIAAKEIYQAKQAVKNEKKATGFHILTAPHSTRSDRRKMKFELRRDALNNRRLTVGRMKSRQLSGLLTLPKRVIAYLSNICKRATVIFAR